MLKKSMLFNIAIVLFVTITDARILNVPDGYPTINSAVESSENGDTVIIAPGSYNEGTTINGKNLTVASNYLLTGDTSFIGKTIIQNIVSWEKATEYSVDYKNSENSSGTLSGITIQNMDITIENGSNLKLSNMRFVNATTFHMKYCLYMNDTISSVTFEKVNFIRYRTAFQLTNQNKLKFNGCTFEESLIGPFSQGGSVIVDGSTFKQTTFDPGGVDSCIVTENTFHTSTISIGNGMNAKVFTLIKKNTFTSTENSISPDNTSITCGGTSGFEIIACIEENLFDNTGIEFSGTGSSVVTAKVSNNTFDGKNMENRGISCHGTGNFKVNTQINSNRFYGANFSISGTGSLLVDAQLVKNVFTDFSGSAVYLTKMADAEHVCTMVNNTIVGNHIGVNCDKGQRIIISNCIIWDNDTDLVNINKEQISYSLWSTGLEPCGITNLYEDPLFVDAANRDFSLKKGSPCIGTGTYESLFALEYMMDENFDCTSKWDIGAIPYQEPAAVFSEGLFTQSEKIVGAEIQGTHLRIGSNHTVPVKIKIYTIQGRLVTCIPGTSKQSLINLKTLHLTPGSYILRIVQGNNMHSIPYLQR